MPVKEIKRAKRERTAVDIAQLAEWFPGMQKSLGLITSPVLIGLNSPTCDPSPWEVEAIGY